MAEDGEWESAKSKHNKRPKNQDEEPMDYEDEEEPDFSDPEDFVDDVTDEELVGDLLKRQPRETDGIESVIVVDCVPEVSSSRLEKLQTVIRKIFSKFGTIQTEHYPKKEDGTTKGYIFVEFKNSAEAADAVAQANGYKLDKQHTFIVNLFSDFEKYADVPEQWEPPTPQEFRHHGNLRYWLLDPHCYDQLSVIYEGGDKTAIFLNTTNEPTVLEERARWTETYVRWSPQGSYLATFHQKGIALWGGEEFKQIMRFSHPGVQLIDYSPCERYMVTFSPMQDSKEDPQAIIIWEILSGQKKRGFHCENASVWPIFKWNHDGTYFARMTPDTLSVYQTPSFGLLDKKSFKIKALKDFSWSPSDNIISHWTPEEDNIPARVSLIDIPSREPLSVKTLFTVADCKLHWQKNGDYLCVKVDRYKSKKEEKDQQIKFTGLYYNFNIFRMREKQIPVDILDVKEAIHAFAWEPTGNKFAIIHGDSPRIGVSFYAVKKTGSVDLLKTFDKRQANHLFWSPNGQFIVLAGLRSMSGILEFVDTNDMSVMMTGEHFMATDVEWDPTGRYVATGVSWWGHKVDNAFWLWNFQGKLIAKKPLERFCQLLWRPKPPSLLTRDKMKDIKKNMKKYNAKFSIEDKMRESTASKEQIERRRDLISEYEMWVQECVDRYDSFSEERLALRGGTTDTEDSNADDIEEEVVEFLIKVEETVLDE